MMGAIIGDIAGSRFEASNHKSKDFELFTPHCSVTDDSIMTLAIAKAILECRNNKESLGELAVEHMQALGRLYPYCGFGGLFIQWVFSDDPEPYNSYGNGAAMRVSPCGYAAGSLEEAKELSRRVTEVTHNHPEGLKGAEATTVAVYLANAGRDLLEIREYIHTHYYPMTFTLDGIRPTYRFQASCQESVPQALIAFFESTGFEDAIRNAVSIGGDSDTIAAIAGAVAGAYYGIPEEIREEALSFLDERLVGILEEFERRYPSTRII